MNAKQKTVDELMLRAKITIDPADGRWKASVQVDGFASCSFARWADSPTEACELLERDLLDNLDRVYVQRLVNP